MFEKNYNKIAAFKSFLKLLTQTDESDHYRWQSQRSKTHG